MFGLIVFVHAVACIGLVTIILMQSGRGGGLTEAFSSAESMFGAKTNEFLIKGTTVLAVIFLITALSLAYMSSREGKSLMSSKVTQETTEEAKGLVDEAKEVVDEAAKDMKKVVTSDAKKVEAEAKTQAVEVQKGAEEAVE